MVRLKADLKTGAFHLDACVRVCCTVINTPLSDTANHVSLCYTVFCLDKNTFFHGESIQGSMFKISELYTGILDVTM